MVSDEHRPAVIFLDDGGVMNDNALRGPQWQRLVGQFLAPLLGGAPEAWAAANRAVVEEELAPMWVHPVARYAEYREQDARAWLLGMCRRVGIAPPPDDEILLLYDRAAAWICPQVRSGIPGAVEAIRTLHGTGYRLMTASGEDSLSLDGYLTGMGVRGLFERLYGPDLIDTTKHGPPYYQRVLEDAGVAPKDALFVDDSPRAVAWVQTVGAQAVRVGEEIEALRDLPGWLESHQGIGVG
jgi:HAD superfamily hydrolase (TIGR01509 family)